MFNRKDVHYKHSLHAYSSSCYVQAEYSASYTSLAFPCSLRFFCFVLPHKQVHKSKNQESAARQCINPAQSQTSKVEQSFIEAIEAGLLCLAARGDRRNTWLPGFPIKSVTRGTLLTNYEKQEQPHFIQLPPFNTPVPLFGGVPLISLALLSTSVYLISVDCC